MRLPALYMSIVFPVLFASLLVAPPSFAGPTWGGCIKVNPPGEYADSHCVVPDNDTGEFIWESYASQVAEKSSGTLTFTDTALGASVKCEEAGEGVVGSGALGETTKITSTGGSAKIKCTSVSACASSPSPEAEATNLPWKTELYEESGKIRITIGKVGEKTPGWKVSCVILGVKANDECTGSTNAGVKNLIEGEGLHGKTEVTFDASSPKTNCTLGGTKVGKIEGTDIIEFAKGGAGG